MSASRHYLVNLLAQGTGRVLGMGASFLSFVLVARVLGSDVLGQYAFLMAFVVTAVTLADFGTTASLTRGIAQEKDRDAPAYFGNFLILRGLLAGAVLLLAVPAALVIKPELRHALLIACVVIPLAAARFFDPIYQVFERARYSMYSSIVLGASRLAIAVVLLLWLEVGLTGYMYGYAAAQMISIGFALALASRLVVPKFKIHRDHLRSVMLLAAPIGVAEIFNALYARADVFMLSYLRTSQEVGIYNAAFVLLDLAVVVAVTATIPLVPILTRKLDEDRAATRRTCMRLMELAVIASLPGPLVVTYVAGPLMTGIYGPEFVASATLLPIFAWLFVLTLCFMVGSAINLAAGKVHHGYWSSAVTAGLNIALNFLLIPEYGAVGAAWATVASIVFKLAVSQYYVWVSVGNIFAPGRWVRILAAGALYYLCLKYSIGEHLVIPVMASSLVYLAVLAVTGMLPLEYLPALRALGNRAGPKD